METRSLRSFTTRVIAAAFIALAPSAQAQTLVRELMRFKLESPLSSDQTVMYLQENATIGFDSKYDAYKILNPGLNLFTIPTGTLKLSINAISNIPTNTDIPLCYKTKEMGMHKITVTQYINPGIFADIYLIDAYTNTSTPMVQGMSLSFEITAGDTGLINTNRFFVSVRKKSTEATVTADIDTRMEHTADADVYPNPIYDSQHLKLHLPKPTSGVVTIDIKNMEGVEIEHIEALYSEEMDFPETEHLTTGTYLIQIHEDEHEYNKRLFKY